MQSRNTRIDNAKGALMVLVIAGHLVYPASSPDASTNALYVFIYLFHMPMFALVSGFLSKADRSADSLISNAKTCLAPFGIFALIHWALLKLVGQTPFPVWESQFGLWYLFSLFCWRVMLPWIPKNALGLGVTVVAALACGLIPQIGLDMSLSRTIVFLPFFMAGHLLKLNNKPPTEVLSPPAGGVLLALAAVAAWKLSGFNVHNTIYGAFSYEVIGVSNTVGPFLRGGHLILTMITGLAFLAVIPSRECLLTRIGQSSLYAYLLHSPLLVLYRAFPELHAFLGQTPFAILAVALLAAWALSSPVAVKTTRFLVSPLR